MDPNNTPEQNSPSESLQNDISNNQSGNAGQTVQPSGPTPPTLATPNLVPKPPAKKGSKTRNLLLLLIIVIAIGAAILVAAKIISKNQPTASVTKHDVADLNVGSTQPFPSTLYPNSQTDVFSLDIGQQVFEGLTKFVNQTQVAPSLAVSWTTPSDTTWVFQLRHGVKFHDGNTMTSAQVASSLMQIQNYPTVQNIPYTIQSAVAQGSYAVKITTQQPDPLLTRELTQFWIWDTNNKTTTNSPVDGTGPFTLKPGTKLTSNSLKLVAYNDYWGPKSTVNELDFSGYSSATTLLDAMKQNKVQIADLTSLATSVPQARQDGFKLSNIVAPEVYSLIPNTLKKGSPLGNLKVRQAIYETINPTLLAKAHNGDTGEPATQLVPPSIPGYNPSIKRPAIDPTAAKALLAQAGYPNGITLTFMYYSPDQDGVAAELKTELAAIGVNLTLMPETSLSVLAQNAGNGSVDMFVLGFSSSILDTSDEASNFVIDTPEFSNSQIDATFSQAQQTFNPTTRLKLLQQLNAEIMDQLAILPVYTPTNQYIAYEPSLVVGQQYLGGITGTYYSQVYSTK